MRSPETQPVVREYTYIPERPEPSSDGVQCTRSTGHAKIQACTCPDGVPTYGAQATGRQEVHLVEYRVYRRVGNKAKAKV